MFATGKLHNALPPLCTQPQPPFVLKTTHFSKRLLFKDKALLFLTWTLSCLVLTEKKRVFLHLQIYMFHTPLQNLYLAFILTLWPKGIQQIILNINFKDYCYVIPGSGYMNLALFSLKCNMCIIKDWRSGVCDASWKSGVSEIFGFPTLCGMLLDTTQCPASPPWALVSGDSTPWSGGLWSALYLQCGHSLVQESKWIYEWHHVWQSDLDRVVWCRRDSPGKKAMAFPPRSSLPGTTWGTAAKFKFRNIFTPVDRCVWKVIWQSATQCAVQCHAWMRSTLTPNPQCEVRHESGGHPPRGRTCAGAGLNWWCCQGLWISVWQDVSPLPRIIFTYP